ncbi:MAG: hypothetical protein HC849_30855 [Oscillatoriales cyanobacterium RU_3_3]|nr:hypothetical protein [Oscillatoriales cyanobacterium RU_3_3]
MAKDESVTAPIAPNFLGFPLGWSNSPILSFLALEMNFGVGDGSRSIVLLL